jgi:hypothetical protein
VTSYKDMAIEALRAAVDNSNNAPYSPVQNMYRQLGNAVVCALLEIAFQIEMKNQPAWLHSEKSGANIEKRLEV